MLESSTTMSVMSRLWADPTFEDAIQKRLAAPADEKPRQPNLRLTDEDLAKIPHREPSKTVPRAEVEAALKTFLEGLAKAQKNNKDLDVKSTDKVWQADMTLHKDLPGELFTPKAGDGRLYQPADLARKIAQLLPDEIPRANFDNFLKLKATDTLLPPDTIVGQLHKKYAETRDAIAAKLPKKIQKYAKSAMDMVVEKGAAYVLDKGLDELDIPSDLKDGVKKVVEDYVKQIAEGKSDKKD